MGAAELLTSALRLRPAALAHAAQTETVVSGTEVLVEAREQVCAPRPVGSLIALRVRGVAAPNGPYPTGTREVAGVKSNDWKRAERNASYTGVRAPSNA